MNVLLILITEHAATNKNQIFAVYSKMKIK